MSYTRVNWENSPSTATPISAENLNTMDSGIKTLDTSVGELSDLDTSDKTSIVSAINEVAVGSGGSGITPSIKSALLACFQNVAWINANGQTYYDALESALGVDYSITYSLSNCSSSNTSTTISSGSRFTSTITASTNYTLNTVTVTMGGVDVTSSVYSSGTITISSVTGDIVITATAVRVAQSITATYTQSGTVYDTDSLDSLKADLVVVANYDDSSTVTLTSDQYTLSGTLAEGTSTITVTYAGLTDTFTVTVARSLDYTLDALTNIAWNEGYTYNQSTGAMQAATGENCSDKFTAQELIHKITIGSDDQYPRLFVWDSNDNYLGYLQHDIIPTNWMLLDGYKYALKVYNTSTFDASSITCIPVDNRETAVSQFELVLSDYLDSISARSGYYELAVTSIMQSFGVSSSNWNNAINRISCLTNIQLNGYSVAQKCPFSIPLRVGFYYADALTFASSEVANGDLEAMQTWITENDVRIRFNY